MEATRRHFLETAALTAISVSFLPQLFAQRNSKPVTRSFDPDSLSIFQGVSAKTFEPWVGSSFTVSLDNRRLGSLVLEAVDVPEEEEKVRWGAGARVTPLGPTGTRKAVESPAIANFYLRFAGSGKSLPQVTYLLTHDWLGAFPLFLVPCGPGRKRTYTATFTLLQ